MKRRRGNVLADGDRLARSSADRYGTGWTRRVRRAGCRSLAASSLSLSRERERARARASVVCACLSISLSLSLSACVCVCVCVQCGACVTCVYDNGDGDDDDDEDEACIVPGRGARSASRGRPFNYARGIGGQENELLPLLLPLLLLLLHRRLLLRLKRVECTEPARRMLPRPLPRHFRGEYERDSLGPFLART